MEKILGRPVLVDNRAGGGGGSVGNAVVARAAPDGYTLLVTLSSLAVLPEADRLFDRPPAYEVSQFTPVARILADRPPRGSRDTPSLPDLTTTRNPRKFPWLIGPYQRCTPMEMFVTAAGIKLCMYHSRGAPALTRLLCFLQLASAPGMLKPQVTWQIRVLINGARAFNVPDCRHSRLNLRDEVYIWGGLFMAGLRPIVSAGGDRNPCAGKVIRSLRYRLSTGLSIRPSCIRRDWPRLCGGQKIGRWNNTSGG